MDFGSIFNKAGETLKHFEQDFSKELGLKRENVETVDDGGGTDEWNNWEEEEEEWVDVDNAAPVRLAAAPRQVRRETIPSAQQERDSGHAQNGRSKIPSVTDGSTPPAAPSSLDQQASEKRAGETSVVEDCRPLSKDTVNEESMERMDDSRVESKSEKDTASNENNLDLSNRTVFPPSVTASDGEAQDQVREHKAAETVNATVEKLQNRIRELESSVETTSGETQNLTHIKGRTLADSSIVESDAESLLLLADASASGSILLSRRSGRLEASERKVRALTMESESLRRTRDSRGADAYLLKEKDNQIQAVLAEGQQLSIKVAEREQQIKRVRSEFKTVEAERDELHGELTAAEAKIESLNSKVRQFETSERSLQEARDAAERRLRELGNQNRSRAGTAAALDAARSELESLRRNQSRALEEQEFRLRAEAQSAMDRMAGEARAHDASQNQLVAELRAHLAQMSEGAGWREDSLRRELADVRRRCQMLEDQNEELAASVPDATRPLLRQIEALQALLSERSKAESIERLQLENLREAEKKAAVAKENRDRAEATITTLTTQVKALEEQNKNLKQDKTQLSSELLHVRTEAAEREERMQAMIDETRNTQLKMQRAAEKDNLLLVEERSAHVEAMKENDEREEELRQTLRQQETQISRLEMALKEAKTKQQAMQVHSAAIPMSARSNDSTDLLDTLSSDALHGQERLVSTLRHKTDELTTANGQLEAKEKALQNMAQEVVRLTADMDRLRQELQDAPETRRKLTELSDRHDTLMILFGEREERVQELDQDLKDVNTMYKEQINDLLLQIEELQRRK